MSFHTRKSTTMVAVEGGKVQVRYYEPHNAEYAQRTPVLMLHGGPGASHEVLYDTVHPLADERPVIFYDQLGSFHSPADLSENQMTVERYADEISCILQSFNLEEVVLFGHSWGAALATYSTLNHRNNVAALVLTSPLLSTQKWLDDCAILLNRLPEDVQQTIETCEQEGATDTARYHKAVTVFDEFFFIRSKKTATKDIWNKHKGKLAENIYNAMWGPSEFRCDGLLKKFDLFYRLEDIEIPTLILTGEYDFARPETMKEAQSKIAGSSLTVVPDSGHMIFLDDPDTCVDATNKFLAENKV